MVALLAACAFALTANYARKEVVVGWLAPEAGVTRVAATQGGVVSRMHVSEGDDVDAQAPIATLSLLAQTTAGSAGNALSHSLEQQRRAAAGKFETTMRRLEAEADRLAKYRQSLEVELQDAKAQIELQTNRVSLAESEVARSDELVRTGFISESESHAKRAALLEARQPLSTLRRSLASLEREITSVTSELEVIPIEVELAQSEAALAIAAIDERTTRTALEIEQIVTSPITGRVEAIPIHLGQTVPPGATVAVIAPRNGELIAVLYVPSRASGFVNVGQQVRLKYDAFPFQRFGTHQSTIESVSLTVLAPDEIEIPGLEIREPVFRARSRLNSQIVEAYGQEAPLRSGMLLTADIVVDQRTLMEWLFDPLYAVGRR